MAISKFNASLTALLLSACAGLPVVANPAVTTPPAPNVALEKIKLPRSLWVWDASVITSPERGTELLDFATQKGITVLYCSLGDIFSARKREAGDPRHVTPEQLASFVVRVHGRGMRVEGLDGDASFALPENHAIALGRLQAALAYNASAPAAARLDGWQWDTEPYLLPAFRKDAAGASTILSQFLDSAAQMTEAVAKVENFSLGYALPFFFDDPKRSLEWRGATRPPAFHFMELLNTLPGGYIALMAYRDKAVGPNGTIALCQGELEYAAKNTPRVKVWIGQETADVKGDPPSITFWQEGEAALEIELAHIARAYIKNPQWGGVALHHWKSYRELQP